MDRVEQLKQLLRKDEYAEEARQNEALQEAANQYHSAISAKIHDKQAPLRRLRNKCAFTKEIISECMCNLYESALLIDDVDKYSKSLRSAMREQVMSIMETATTNSDLVSLFENSSPYVKGMLVLAEEAYDNKTDEEIKEFENKVILSKDDLSLINKFETEEGKDVYAQGLQDRIIDVYKAEEKMGQEQKGKVQAVVDELSKINNVSVGNNTDTGAENDTQNSEQNTVTESIEHGVRLFNNTPKTIFNAIFVNKSKSFMNESASADLMDNGEKILAETIATYTLLETIHALGFKTYSEDEKRKLKMDFFVS